VALSRVDQRTTSARDLPIAEVGEVVGCKRRWICGECLCKKATFAESTARVPARARSTIRLRHEHRPRSVRYCRTPAGGWRPFETWTTTIVDVTTGQVVGVVDGRDSAGAGAWLQAPARAVARPGGGHRDRPVRRVPPGATNPAARRRGQPREHLQHRRLRRRTRPTTNDRNSRTTRVLQRSLETAASKPLQGGQIRLAHSVDDERGARSQGAGDLDA